MDYGQRSYNMEKKITHVIGIDPGTKTGVAFRKVKDNHITQAWTCSILKAMEWLKFFRIAHDPFVFIEDPNLRKWFGNTGREKLQGAGSIKRDFAIWTEFLTFFSIPFHPVAPANVKTYTPEALRTYNIYTGKTSIHARDAIAMALMNPIIQLQKESK